MRLTHIALDGFNDPNAIPCQQTFEYCDQIATVHIVGEHPVDGTAFDVDTCPEHAARVVLNWAEADNERGTYPTR